MTTALFFMLNNSVLAQVDYSDYQDNNEGSYTYSATSYPKITNLENKLYHKSFVNDDVYNRLSRIEGTLFSHTFKNEALIDRVDRISDKLDVGSGRSYTSSQSNDIATSSPLNDLKNMETRTFGSSYPKDNPIYRVERLERQVLGATQSGDLDSRIESLKIASQQQYFDDFNTTSFMSKNLPYSSGNTSSFPLYGSGNHSTYSGNSQDGILNYVIPTVLPFIQNLLNFKSNSNDNFSQPSSYHSYSTNGATAGVHILD